jgi:dihydroorotase
MQLLIRSARIIDNSSPYNGQIKDILLENELIIQIGDNLSIGDVAVYEANNLHISAGWVDMRVTAHDPGHEHKEDLQTVCKAAAAGGFTEIAVLPNTSPALDSKDTVGYVQRVGQGSMVRVHAVAAVTKKCLGVDFTEMIDLTHAGAVAFSDGVFPIQNTHILLKTLQYLQPLNRVLMNRAEDAQLAVFGQMNEGITSTMLGLRGIPTIAEELAIMRDLKLLDYVDAKTDRPLLHFSTISTAESVTLIREAKRKGLPVSCDVAAHQMAFDDSIMTSFDTNYKVVPPFRSQADIDALWEGLADGTIDAVVSDHLPQDEEAKNLEFDLAEFGIIGLETVFSLLINNNNKLTVSQIIEKLTQQPRRILRLPELTIKEGAVANLTLFNPDLEWQYGRSYSKSKNSPFLGKTLTGKVLGVVNNGKSSL